MRRSLFHITLMMMALGPVLAYAYTPEANQDTIRPVFTTLPSNIDFDCNTDDLTTLFTNWFQDQAGAVADNGGAPVFPTIPLNQGLDSLDMLINNLCVSSNEVSIEFFALDSCGNQSLESQRASFILNDTEKPQFEVAVADKEVFCTASTIDSLQAWLDNKGGASVSDNCSGTVFTNYIWNDDLGNSGFNNFEDSTNISIQRANCIWEVTVSFFVEDNCGNDNVSTARFSIVGDTIAPVLTNELRDTTLLCDQLIPDELPSVTDQCDGDLVLIQIDSSTQNTSPDSCSFYRYELVRQWTAEDACGNISETARTFTIEDTLAPVINLSPIVPLNCDEDISDLSDLITVTDGCTQPLITFRDSIIFNSSCQNQFIRTWIATDPCGNQDSVNQTIQIQDFSGPEFLVEPTDLRISCTNPQLSQIFDQWVIDNSQDIVDGCNGSTFRILPEGDYVDTLVIAMTPDLSFQDLGCSQGDSLGIVNSLAAQFIAYDACGNITQQSALFSITDDQSPTIDNCPSDFNLQVNADQCSVDYRVVLPTFFDNCLTVEDAKWEVDIDGSTQTIDNQQSLQVGLDIGEHNLIYRLEDCGNNITTCTQNINVADNTSPTLTCVDSLRFFVGPDECGLQITPPSIISFQDNCFGETDYFQSQPDNEGFLDFSFNSIENVFQASDFVLTFTGVDTEGLIVSPHLIIEYKLALENNSTISIVGELGELITRIGEQDCIEDVLIVELNSDDVINWAEDNRVRFTILNQSNGGQGTLPCSPNNIPDNTGQDQDAFLKLSLGFTDLQPTLSLTNLGTGTSTSIDPNPLNIATGNYTLNYEASDAVGNMNSCTTSVAIIDTISPILVCEEITFELDPLLEGFYPLIESDLNFTGEDNCDFTILDFQPRQVLCDEQNIPYTITGTDPSGNQSQCTNTIRITKPELNPTFVSGLCLADTLKFLSNLPEFSGFTYEWSGPDNFSSTEANPIITGITDESSGEYILTATSNGCSFEGSIQIDVELFDSPEIFSNLSTICNGEELLINTNSFTEIVEYFWFEGISPNGTLIFRTDGPSLTLNPVTGTHFYYVEVKGDNCNSNPSNTLEVVVSSPPEAEIAEPFITTCVGDDIVLMTNVFNPNYQYEWSGPNNYNSTGQFPEVIEDITESNQGTYTLITKEGECVSDTATAQVIVFEPPPQPIITGDNIFCEGQSAVLTVPNIPNGTNYQWFNEGIFFTAGTSNNLLLPSLSQSESGEWTVIVERGICKSDTSDVFILNLESTLNIGATNDGPVCDGDNVMLTTSFIPNATYTWTDPSGTTIDGRIITVLAEAGVYTVDVTTESNCTASTTTVVEVGVRPVITALSNTSLPCLSGTNPVTFVSTVFPPGNYQYSWSGPNGFTSNQQEPIISNFNEQNNGTYTLTVINEDCDSEPISNDINITLIPPTPEIINSTLPCLGDAVTFSIINPITGVDVSWIWTTPTGQEITNLPELIVSNFQNNNSGNYSVVQQVGGCRSLSSPNLDLQLQTAPLTPIITGQENACEGEDVLLTVNIDNADSYLWFTPQGTTNMPTNEFELNDVSVQNEGAYSVFITSGNCTSDTSITFNLKVNPTPQAPRFVENEIQLCATDAENLELCLTNLVPPIDEVRIIDLETETTLQSGLGNCLNLDFLLDSPREYNLGVLSILDGCSSDTGDTITLQLTEHPEIGAEVEDSLIICGRDFASVNAINLPNGTEVLWSSDDPELNLFDVNTTEVSLSNLRPGINNIFLTSSIGSCENYFTDSISVNVLTTPEANDDFLDLPFGQEILIAPVLNDEFSSSITLTILEDPSEGTATINETIITYVPENGLVGDDLIQYEICYDECPEECATATIFLTIGIEVDCFVGNLITPNGDGQNDALKVPCLATGNFLNNSILIFNEWGDEVFSAAPYENDWEGIYNGQLLPVGTYYYIMDLGDGSQPLSGFLVLEL